MNKNEEETLEELLAALCFSYSWVYASSDKSIELEEQINYPAYLKSVNDVKDFVNKLLNTKEKL